MKYTSFQTDQIKSMSTYKQREPKALLKKKQKTKQHPNKIAKIQMQNIFGENFHFENINRFLTGDLNILNPKLTAHLLFHLLQSRLFHMLPITMTL